MLGGVEDHLIFPAPNCSYSRNSYRRHLLWVPWNKEIWIPPELRGSEEKYLEHGGIPCMWFPAPKAAMVMFFSHGNAEDLGMSFSFIRHMRDQFKVNVFAVEYPGYGLISEIRGCEEALNAVVSTAFRFLVDQIGVAYESIVLFGRSIGTGPSCALASKYPVGGLILVCAFLSIKAAVHDIAGRLVASMFADKFRNIAVIQNVSSPTLLIHGESDCMIPVRHSVELFKKCRSRKLLVTPPKMEHNSNLFGDASYLAVPAINFFGLPGYCTATPPRIPASYFVHPKQIERPKKELSTWDKKDSWFWWCGIILPNQENDCDSSGTCTSDLSHRGDHSAPAYSTHPQERDSNPEPEAEMSLSERSTTLSNGS
eukprot:GEMP01010788.1.p1 GENE.GEMP01010788.1~~GEMP01010788.1.p1  ORF type:complete len:369 (+),score=35.93 GEMP01010788.1:157-1263(+)